MKNFEQTSFDLKKTFPFESKKIDINGLGYHYIDEGDGEPIVMVHGNPTWSFYYRNLITGLKGKYRVIAPDHIGCGLSDKPQDYNYTLKNHIENFKTLLDHLGLKNITLAVHDWGGAIGMGWAVKHSDRVKRIVVFNTAAFLMKKIPFRINVCRIPVFGDIAIRYFNLFAGLATTMACKKRERMTPEVKAGYLMPYNNYANRIAVLRFVQDIPLTPKDQSYGVVKDIEDKLYLFDNTPMMIIWGEKDFCFNNLFLERWTQYFPKADVKRLSDAGHYVVEDAWEQIVPWMEGFCAS